MNVRYIVDLTAEEREELQVLVKGGSPRARKVLRALILLMADGRRHTDASIVDALPTSTSTVYRVKKRFVEEGLDLALNERARRGGARKLDAKQEAFLVARACSEPPKGRSKWTLQLLADELVASTGVKSVSAETIRRRLKEKQLKPWQKKMWCISKLDADFVAKMEHILDLYAEPHDPSRPVVCVDEAFKQLVAETREPLSAEPGKPERYDYEYRRAGTSNIYLMLDRHRGWRHAKPTQTKGNTDFAHLMRELVDVHYPDADVVRVVLDNLNTHRPGALYKTFPPQEARRILRRIEFHYTPKHASWLNMVEIEIGVMSRQCLDRRIDSRKELAESLAAWEVERNDARASIEWLFDVDRARVKLARAYPNLKQSESL